MVMVMAMLKVTMTMVAMDDDINLCGEPCPCTQPQESGAGEGGYAKESSKEFQEAQKQTFAKHLRDSGWQ